MIYCKNIVNVVLFFKIFFIDRIEFQLMTYAL